MSDKPLVENPAAAVASKNRKEGGSFPGSVDNQRVRQKWANKLKKDFDALQKKYGHFSDSAILIREDRDERG